METNNFVGSPKDRGRSRLLAVRPTTARATSGSAPHHHHHTPHSPRSPLYTDSFTLSHPPIHPPPDLPSSAISSANATAPDRPPSPSQQHPSDGVGHTQFQYALSSAQSVPTFNATFDQAWPRADHDDVGDGVGDEDEDPDESYSPRQTARRGSTKTTSGSSSSRFFRSVVYKFGRAFNRNYFLPHDKQEQERNNLQHEISVEVHDGELHLCPVVNPKRVLDVGTGTGIWAVEFAKRHPDSEILGIDLNPVPPPPFIVPNVQFLIADVFEEWRFASTCRHFDFVHVRSLGEPADKKRLFKNIYEHLAPGGWVEFQEWVLHAQSSDRSLEGTAFQKWNKLIAEGVRKLGKSLFYILEYRNMLEATGFQNIVELKYAVPTNTWPPGRQSQRIGAMQKSNTLQVIDVYSLGVFTQGLGWSKDALDRLLAEVRKDIENTRIHSYSTLMTVYCQKPLASSAQSFDTTASPKQQRQSVS
ncbi:S-adenosyl-L-methionine-dependent methyltransferase [Hypomontagnella submonticulosa]|nr:S-adenosyl-L-methionine-dependent methyltransferase [Hypomontagnella submonticulosa]